MQIAPILATLRHHKLTAILLALQVAFACAIVTNALFLIVQRVERVLVPSGLDENALSIVEVNDLDADANPLGVHRADLATLKALPGVESAAIVSHVPFANSQHGTGSCANLDAVHAAVKARALVPGCATADMYAGGPGSLSTLGLRLVAGRGFRADEYVTDEPGESIGSHAVAAVIVSQALAQRLFPQHPDHVVDRVIYFGASGLFHGQGTRIVGVVEHLHRANISNDDKNDQSLLLPEIPNTTNVTFALRSEPGEQPRVMEQAKAALLKLRPQRQISADHARTYKAIRSAYFKGDRTMISLLLAATLGLLFVTALGIAGLAGFWVQQRTRSIGIRRAIGATRSDILRYFQTENFLIVGVGVGLGLAMAVLLNLLLMQHYELPRLPTWYLPVGAATLWLLGQLAVLNPALRAANVPPVVATRSV